MNIRAIQSGEYSIITLGTGQTVELNADGTLTVVGDGDVENVNFTYAIESSTGESDTGFVLLNMVPCFVACSATNKLRIQRQSR